MGVSRGEVHLVNLDPTIGSVPCLIMSPDEANRHLKTVIVAPLTTGGKLYPTRVPCKFQGKPGTVVLDQIRTIDRARLTKRLGRLDAKAMGEVLAKLQELFAP